MKVDQICLGVTEALQGNAKAKSNCMAYEIVIPPPCKSKRKARFLMLGVYSNKAINTVKETINCIIEKSAYQIEFLRMELHQSIPACVNLNQYQGIIFHNTLLCDIDFIDDLLKNTSPKFSDYTGIKILVKQDEMRRAYLFHDIVRRYKFDLVVTLCDKKLQEYIYQASKLPNTIFMQYLTGYVSDHLKSLPYNSDFNRAIDVGYRSIKNPLYYGRLTYEKYKIGQMFLSYAKGKDIKVDISCKPEDRIYGESWFEFLGNCKAVLGVESGGSIIDITGEAEKTFDQFVKENPNASDEEILNAMLPFEGGLWYNAISPRHFEAAACFTLQILYEGDYQGIFKPYRHYLPLKKDWSNIDEIMKIAMNPERRRKIVECAYSEIIQNPIYSFDQFVCKFDERLKELLAKKQRYTN